MMAEDERVVFYSASFFKLDGVVLTIRGLISYITDAGGRVLVLTADDPSESAVSSFRKTHPEGQVDVLRVVGGIVPVSGADYYMGLYVTKGCKRKLEEFCPSVVHLTNPDLVAPWVSGGLQSFIPCLSEVRKDNDYCSAVFSQRR